MNAAEQLDALAAECGLLAGTSESALTIDVPSMPGFTIEKVIRHVTSVHRIAAQILRAPDGTEMSEILAALQKSGRGPQSLLDYRTSADDMLAQYARRDPARRVATWGGPDSPDYWIRRQLHEVTVHRFDVQDALLAAGERGEPEPANARAAADGISEWAEAFLPRFPGDAMPAMVGRTVHIHTTDGTDTELFLDFRAGGVVVTHAHAKGDVALRGRAQDLLLAVWRRRPLDELDVVGDAAVARELLSAVRI